MMPSGSGSYNGKVIYKMGILWKEGKVLRASLLRRPASLLRRPKLGDAYLLVGDRRACT